MCRTQGTRVQNGRETHAGKSPREEFSFLGYGSLRAFASATGCATCASAATCMLTAERDRGAAEAPIERERDPAKAAT